MAEAPDRFTRRDEDGQDGLGGGLGGGLLLIAHGREERDHRSARPDLALEDLVAVEARPTGRLLHAVLDRHGRIDDAQDLGALLRTDLA